MILVASYSTAIGGAERLLVDFVSALDGERAIACPDGPVAGAARAAGLRVLPVRPRPLALRSAPASAVRHLAGHALELRRLMQALAPELVIAWGMRSALACRLAGVSAPLIFQHNDLLPGPALGAVVRSAAARADRVLTLSETIATDLDPHGRLGGRIQIVYPGVDVDRFAASGPPPIDPPTVLVLGALVSWKRPDVALDAVALLRRVRPEARLRFVGAPLAGEEAIVEGLRDRARAPELAGAVEFAGAVADVAAELTRATCLLHCAEREPFGLAVVEALASGRPAVVPSAGGPAEIVDRSCGLLYPAADAAAAAEALGRVVSDPALALRLGSGGRVRAAARFDSAGARRRWAAAVGSVGLRRRERQARVPAGSTAVVTVTHNSAAWLEALLESVQRHLAGARVVVVDCGSDDDSVAIAEGRSGVFSVPLGENVGFGRGCNVGLAAVHEPVTLLLNPDVELVDDSLLELATEVLREDRPERLLAPLVLYPDGTRQDTVHPVPGSGRDIVTSIVPGPGLGLWRASHPRPVGWAVGCALAARTATLRRLGPFDERLFLYGEDLDLGLRAAAAGITTWFWPCARVLHHRAHSAAPAFGGEPAERLARARREVVARRLGARRLWIDDAVQAVTFGSRIAAKRALGRTAQRERRRLRALLSVRR